MDICENTDYEKQFSLCQVNSPHELVRTSHCRAFVKLTLCSIACVPVVVM